MPNGHRTYNRPAVPCCLFIQLPELLFTVQGTARGLLEAAGLTINPSMSSPLQLTRALSYELPLLRVLYKPSLNTILLWGGGFFFRQPSHGKRHQCTSVSLLFTHGQSPSLQPCCMCSLPGMHNPGLDFGPCPSCSKQRGAALPPSPHEVANPQGSSQLHPFSHQYNLPRGNQLRAGRCWGQVKAADLCESVPLAMHCFSGRGFKCLFTAMAGLWPCPQRDVARDAFFPAKLQSPHG